MLKNVRVSNRLKEYGVKENHKGFPTRRNIRVFGADTETSRGRIFSFQIASEGEEALIYTTEKNAFHDFMGWLDSRTLDKGVNLVFFHNLRFDATVLFVQDREAIYNQYNDIHLERDGYVIQMLYGRVNFVRVWKDLGGFLCPYCGDLPALGVKRIGGSNLCANPLHGEPVAVRRNLGALVQWMDSAAFCPPGSKSLSAALKIYGVAYQKFAAPVGLGKRKLRGRVFEAYALNDARAEEALGNAILSLHKNYDVSPCISLPQLAGRILRHHFFRPKETFPFPPEPCRLASELSYHAGKNGFYVAPGVYENLYEYDINSAFPQAMKEMPQMVKGEYRHVRTFRPHHALGIYRISGRWTQKRYPLVFSSAFKPLYGNFRDIWITGYELGCLSKSGADHYVHEGWVWRERKSYGHSPLQEFVERFWKLKSDAPKGPERDTYKNILNSLYGKFAACVEKRPFVDTALGRVLINDGPASEKYFDAGALYHPFIASQITGYVRARLYELEKEGDALHAATDSIKSFRDLPTSAELGGIKKEVFGRCYLFRNKLYLHFAKDTSLCAHDLAKGWLFVTGDDKERLPEVGAAHRTGQRWDAHDDKAYGKLFDHDGQHLCKYGLHGYHGSAFYLYAHRNRLLSSKVLDYEVDHMMSLREGWKQGKTVCDMHRLKKRLTLL